MGIFDFGKNWQARKEAEGKISSLEEEGIAVNAKGRKRRIDQAIIDQREISRRAFMQLLGGGAVVASGVVGMVGGAVHAMKDPEFDYDRKPSVPMTSIAPATLTSQDDFSKSMELQRYWKSLSMEALEMFRGADPRVAELIDFMSKNAYYSIPVGPVVTQTVFKSSSSQDEIKALENNPYRFEMVYMPERYAVNMPAAILTEPDGTMRIATNFRMKEWLGVMLTHELSHEYDIKVNGENPRNKGEYLAGEVKAHSLEMKLLKSWDPKSYAALIKRGTPLWEGMQRGATIDTFVKLCQSLYPTTPEYVSARESSLGIASCIVAVVFESARAKGATDKDLESLYQDIFRRFGGG